VHSRFLPPENRTDKDFFAVVLNKLEQIFQITKEHNCSVLFQPGDMFDAPDPSRFVISSMLRVFRKYSDIKVFGCLGQHDLAYRSWQNFNRTASYLLESAGVLTIVGLDGKAVELEKNIFLHGHSFEQTENLSNPVEGAFNILLAHATVGTRPLFPGHELPSPKAFAKKNPGYSLIVLGDIHYAFHSVFQDTNIFNAGVVLRKTIAEKEQKPNVIIYDTETGKFEIVFLKVEPWQNVFTIPKKAKEEQNNKLQKFIAIVQGKKKSMVSFDDNLQTYYVNNEVAKPVQDRVALAMEKCGMKINERKEL